MPQSAIFDDVYWDSSGKLSAMGYGQKRTVTVTFEVTHHQCNQLRALGRTLWPDRVLDHNEVCRRVLLEGADLMRGSSDERCWKQCGSRS
jgi:hypothetical protein